MLRMNRGTICEISVPGGGTDPYLGSFQSPGEVRPQQEELPELSEPTGNWGCSDTLKCAHEHKVTIRCWLILPSCTFPVFVE